MRGVECGSRVHHGTKLKKFLESVERQDNATVEDLVADLNGQIGSLRNRLLYPRMKNQRVICPENEISQAEVHQLLQEIQTIVQWVGQQI